MEYSDYNDNEIIYLIKSGNEDAYHFMVKKYSRMLYSRINRFHLDDLDDAFQEGLICLYNAIMAYDETINKTFNKYFEVVLHNKLADLKKKRLVDYEYFLSEKIIGNTCSMNESVERLHKKIKIDEIMKISNILNKREKNIFYEYYIEGMSIDDISLKEKIDKQYIYYLIHEIKDKIKKNM